MWRDDDDGDGDDCDDDDGTIIYINNMNIYKYPLQHKLLNGDH